MFAKFTHEMHIFMSNCNAHSTSKDASNPRHKHALHHPTPLDYASLTPTASALQQAQLETTLLPRSQIELPVRPGVRCYSPRPGIVIYDYGFKDEAVSPSPRCKRRALLFGRRSPCTDRGNTSSVHVPGDGDSGVADLDEDDVKRQIHLRSLLLSLREPAFIAGLGTGWGWKESAAWFAWASARELAVSLGVGVGKVGGGEVPVYGYREEGGILKVLNGEDRERRFNMMEIRWGAVEVVLFESGKEVLKKKRRTREIIEHDLIEFD